MAKKEEAVMTAEQRKRFFAMLDDIAEQVDWPVNGDMGKLGKDDWKLILTAAYKQETRIAQGINGGQVVLGLRLRDIFRDLTDEQAKWEASELIALVDAFGSSKGVVWSKQESRNV